MTDGVVSGARGTEVTAELFRLPDRQEAPPLCEYCAREEPCDCGLYRCLCTCGRCKIPPGTPEYERYMALLARNN